MSASQTNIRPVGERALLVEGRSLEQVHRLWRALRSPAIDGVEEVVAGAETVLVVAAPGADLAGVAAQVSKVAREVVGVADSPSPSPSAREAGREVVIPVLYRGPDLADVANLAGMSQEEVVRRHHEAVYTVAFLGFSPGFGYLAGGDPALSTPRLHTPRTSVPAGSVAVAGNMTAIYPQATPGGWRLIGRTSEVMFDPLRAEPALLAPGDRVRFRPVDGLDPPASPAPSPLAPASTLAASLAPLAAGPVSEPNRTIEGYIEILDPGPFTTVQDLGRVGWAHAGVPRAGALDRASALRSNRLVGNPDTAAVLEATFAGPRLLMGAGRLVAVCGARAEVIVDGLPAQQDAALALPAGAELTVRPYRSGARVYVAFSGGVAAGEALGSRSTDTLSGLGPPTVRAGERVALGPTPSPVPPAGPAPKPRDPAGNPASPGVPIVVTARLGPRHDWITPAGIEALRSSEFVVHTSSDRTGVRLDGPPVHPAHSDRQLPSEGMVAGAVEVPPDGRPIVLLRNHPTTGGYPVVAVVDDGGIDALAQARPGDRVRFVVPS